MSSMDDTQCIYEYEVSFKSMLGCVKISRLTRFSFPQSQLYPNIFHDQPKVRAIPSSITRASISISIFHNLRKPTAPIIIIFGETGAGKSSVVNMLPGGPDALVRSDAKGVTFEHTRYERILGAAALIFSIQSDSTRELMERCPLRKQSKNFIG